MFSLERDEMTALWPKDCLTFTFYLIISNSIPNSESVVKEVFDPKFSLERDEMTALWPTHSLTFTFYLTFSKTLPNWTTFDKKVFWLNV